ncbi:MAG: 23S rRNA (pseudouridine(1915)-N(3))-methyltransferase RlmH [Gemmatimonadota bacterium]
MIQIVAVGSVRGPLRQVLDDYEKRAGRYWRFEVVEIPRARMGSNASGELVRQDEGRRMLDRIPRDAQLVALTVHGTPFDSVGLARFLEDQVLQTGQRVVFALGGAFGLDDSVLDRATRTFSLGAGTLPHELARVVLTEQIYRAGTILRNEPYHKGSAE